MIHLGTIEKKGKEKKKIPRNIKTIIHKFRLSFIEGFFCENE